MEYESLFKAARQAGTLLAETETERLGRTLMHAAQLLRTHTPRLLEANARDLEAMAPDSPLRDRLRLTPERIAAIADDMEAVAHLPSPQGETIAEWTALRRGQSGDGFHVGGDRGDAFRRQPQAVAHG